VIYFDVGGFRAWSDKQVFGMRVVVAIPHAYHYQASLKDWVTLH
jgi:hypothetical protein